MSVCRAVSGKPPRRLYCEAQWDGLVCFNYTKASSDAYVPCPDFPVYNPDEKVHRYCEANGTWQVDASGKVIRDLSNCVKNRSAPNLSAPDEAFSYIYLFIAGASLSLVLLIISLIIFYGFRQLRCDRVTVHKNLFISFACTALAWILYYSLVALDGHVILDNPWLVEEPFRFLLTPEGITENRLGKIVAAGFNSRKGSDQDQLVFPLATIKSKMNLTYESTKHALRCLDEQYNLMKLNSASV
ncbi:hypothetical protein RRG08_041757 [Elysia crispata]|uniref:G-protein coupled receptors family 2 profile 1 domain-containing protein n=1 Tax=Elysia crispata TaxID=231223 RepID=A0AAE0YYX2_9GAST|nr:hypothetical protein RRG08_041757 [Elysia crispata]